MHQECCECRAKTVSRGQGSKWEDGSMYWCEESQNSQKNEQKPCPEGKVRNEKTGRCISAPSKPKSDQSDQSDQSEQSPSVFTTEMRLTGLRLSMDTS